jgi:hypothetical protein
MLTSYDRMLELCEQYPDAINYNNYSEIPSDLKCEGFLTAWVVSGAGSLRAIPAEERTEMMMCIAAGYDSDAFALIKPEDVSDYQSVILDAIGNNPSVMADVPDQYITEDLITKAANRRIGALGYIDFKGRYKHLLTDPLISSVVSINVSTAIRFASEISQADRNRIKDDDLIKAIKVQVNDLHELRAIGKTHLLVDLLVAGYWPSNLNASIKMERGQKQDISLPPTSPHEALSRLACMSTQGVRCLHLQSLRRFPIEEVILTTQDIPKVVDLLMQVYSERELKQHMKLSGALRGRLLEGALGL